MALNLEQMFRVKPQPSNVNTIDSRVEDLLEVLLEA